MKTKKTIFAIALILTSISSWAQSSITGTIYENNSTEPLIGATILIKGSNNGCSTNMDGKYSLDYKGEFPITIVVSFIGYDSKEIVLESSKSTDIYLSPSSKTLNEVTVTARRRNEELQDIPIPIAVIGGKEIDNSVSFNVNRVKELVPSVQLYSSNPRNTTLNIRGIGSTFGLTNDGIDPGVGFYVDGVYYARPAATTLDFIDVNQIEVLRGPQGTLFGKNTTAGTFNITTKKPSFNTTATIEQSFGNFGFIQSKGTVSGSLIKNILAVRLSFSGTYRDGTIYNERTEKFTNTLNNQGAKLQFHYLPSKNVSITLTGDYTRQRPDGYAQVFAGVVPTERAAYRQFENIIADLNYDLPSRNPFDRLIDYDTPFKSNQDMGGVSLNADFKIGKGTLTSTSAWRTWVWGPSSDRDFTGLQALTLSQAPSIHNQYSQEVRYAGEFNEKLSGVIGLFGFYQTLEPDGAHREEVGKDQWRFAQNSTSALWATPGLLDGYGITTNSSFKNLSGALFGQLDWKITKRITILPGIRLNYDQKEVDFKRQTYGGLQTTDPALIALQKTVYTNQEFSADIDDWNVSGQLTASFKLHQHVRIFANAALGFKPVGLNLGGLPTQSGRVMTELAVVKPERVHHYEIGVKSEPNKNTILNLTAFNTDIFDYQTNVQAAELGVNRGYLSNAEQVNVRGIELEANYYLPKYIRVNGSLSYTEAKYVKFTNAPVPLEETGGETFKDISGGLLPGVSKWTVAGGMEGHTKGKLLEQEGEYFLGIDAYYRSGFSSSPSPSQYLNIDGYALLNARIGFRVQKGITIFAWARNIADQNYFEQLLPGAGNAGHYAAVLGDPRTYGLTLRYNFF